MVAPVLSKQTDNVFRTGKSVVEPAYVKDKIFAPTGRVRPKMDTTFVETLKL